MHKLMCRLLATMKRKAHLDTACPAGIPRKKANENVHLIDSLREPTRLQRKCNKVQCQTYEHLLFFRGGS